MKKPKNVSSANVRHIIKYQREVSASQTSLTQAFSKASPYDKKASLGNISNAVTVYLYKDMVPFQTVDRKGFKDRVKTLGPGTCCLPALHSNGDAKTIWRGPGASG
jgi:hypothetical protein